ncbi:OsmC family peroxiredoxin [bacterium]|nr:MAG: OsmC family peroxiredoxin [bacterium]
MTVRTAEAEWKGDVKQGSGSLKLGSGAFSGVYSFGSRFESAAGTNPEELIGAAHAGCFSMALSLILGKAGFTPKRIHTTAKVTIDIETLSITTIDLTTEAEVPGIDEKAFQKCANDAKEGCPVSKALAGAKISLQAKLLSAA